MNTESYYLVVMKYILLILLLSCVKTAEVEAPVPRIQLPEMDEDLDFDDLPEAGEDDTGSNK